MGSLMAGWQTNRSAPQQIVKQLSTSSVTNSEVQRFWRSKRSSFRSHIQYVESRLEAADLETTTNKSDSDRSDSENSSPPTTASPLSSFLPPARYDGERTGWWTRSSSAHLNEPPLVESKQGRYKSQFDVYEVCDETPRVVQRRNSLSAMVIN